MSSSVKDNDVEMMVDTMNSWTIMYMQTGVIAQHANSKTPDILPMLLKEYKLTLPVDHA
jgi:hypothetical protein